jgi:hypothetical protein
VAVRLIDALVARLDGEGLAPAAALEPEPAPSEAAERLRRKLHRMYVHNDVVWAIDAETRGDAERAETLRERLHERLTELADREDFLELPVGMLATHVCSHLGVAYDPAAWDGEDADEDASGRPLDPPADLQGYAGARRHWPP